MLNFLKIQLKFTLSLGNQQCFDEKSILALDFHKQNLIS
jgi:hypothetical protein